MVRRGRYATVDWETRALGALPSLPNFNEETRTEKKGAGVLLPKQRWRVKGRKRASPSALHIDFIDADIFSVFSAKITTVR